VTRVAVVTGASGGIGSATCEKLMSEGWDVVAMDRRPPVVANVSKAVHVDFGDPHAIRMAIGDLPRIDALVNNAGIMHTGPLETLSVSEWDETLAVNLSAAFHAMAAARQALVDSHGAVVNVSSVHAAATSMSVTAYAASKAGLLGLTRAAALEFAPFGVRVNAVAPGASDTAMLNEGLARSPDGLADARIALMARIPLGGIAERADIANAIAFLVGDRSSYVTGQTLFVDGGVLARLASE
jgi:NAD(P)-dependent dehydrogenase (short-subunit alcohol dehydrogenase family)